MYIRKVPKDYTKIDITSDSTLEEELSLDNTWIAEDDVMTLINTLMQNTKSETIESNTGDPFWEKAEMVFLQSIIFVIL